ALGVCHEWWHDLAVTMLSMDVEHEVDETPFETGAQPREKGKARSGNFGSPFEVQNTQFRAEVPVCFGLEVEPRRFTDAADFDVLLLAHSDRDVRIGQIRDRGCETKETLFHPAQGLLDFFDFLRYRL